MPCLGLRAFAATLGFLAACSALPACGVGLDTSYSGCGVPSWKSTAGNRTLELGTGSAYPTAVVADSCGDVYLIGNTTASLNGKPMLDSGGDYYLMKLGPGGRKAWLVEDGSATSSLVTIPSAIAIDAAGYVYVGGSVSGSMDGAPQVSVSGQYDYFLSKYDGDGNLKWTIQDGPTAAGKRVVSQTTGGMAILPDAQGNVYVASATSGAMDGQQYVSTGSQPDYFLTSRRASDGAFQSLVEDGNSGTSFDLESAALDSSGNIYVVGDANGTLDQKSVAVASLYLSQYVPGAGHQLTRSWTQLVQPVSGVIGSRFTVAVDSANSFVYVSGAVSDAAGQPGKMPGASTAYGTGQNAFLSQFSLSGAGPNWTAQDGPSNSEQAQGWGTALDGNGFVYLYGSTQQGLDGNTQLNTSSGYDYFLSQYDRNGNRKWTTQGGTPGSGRGFGIASTLGIDGAGNLYVFATAYQQGAEPGMDGNPQLSAVDLTVTQINNGE